MVEGRDYQCAFYAGSLLANVEISSDGGNDAFANLLKLNSNIAFICDGDRTSKSSRLKPRVQKVKKQLREIPNSYLWITEAKEIENYIPGVVWKAVYNKKRKIPDPGRYDKFPTQKLEQNNTFVFKTVGYKSFDKCEFASKAVEHLSKEILSGRFELEKKINELINLIYKWNA